MEFPISILFDVAAPWSIVAFFVTLIGMGKLVPLEAFRRQERFYENRLKNKSEEMDKLWTAFFRLEDALRVNATSSEEFVELGKSIAEILESIRTYSPEQGSR